MGINLRRRYTGVSQHFLNRPQVSTTAQHVSSKAMPQGMGGNLLAQPSRFSVSFQYLPQTLPGKPATTLINEQSLLSVYELREDEPL